MTQGKKKADSGTVRSENSKKASEMSERKRAYLADKSRLLEREKDNYSQLMLVQTPGGWWNMFGHSAIIYKYYVAERLKMPVKLRRDTDYSPVSEEGVIAFADINKLKDRLKPLKIYPVNMNARGWIFDLGEKISVEDYNLMVQEEERTYERTNQLMMPVEHITNVHTRIRDMFKIVWEVTRKMDGVARDVFAIEMSKRMARLEVMAVRVARGTADVDEMLATGMDVMEDLYGYTSIMLNTRLLEPKKILALTETIVYLEKALKQEMKKRAALRVEAEMTEKIKEKTKAGGKDGKEYANPIAAK